MSEIGAHFSFVPLRSRWKFQGTMLEWCSMMESTISSPSPEIPARNELAHQVDPAQDIAQGTRGEEVFLLQAQLASLGGIIVGVKHLADIF